MSKMPQIEIVIVNKWLWRECGKPGELLQTYFEESQQANVGLRDTVVFWSELQRDIGRMTLSVE